MIQPVILEGAGDATTDLARGITLTIIPACIVHCSLAGTRRRRGRLRQVAQLVWMRTVTVKVLLLGTASIHRTLSELTQIDVGILIGVIATQRALIGGTATRAVACGGHGGVVASPEVLGLATNVSSHETQIEYQEGGDLPMIIGFRPS